MTKCICVWYWFIFLPYISPFLKKKIVEGNKHICVIKTSSDKGGACANEKRKRCNRIPSEITLGRNYPSAEYTYCIFPSFTRLYTREAILTSIIKHVNMESMLFKWRGQTYFISWCSKWDTLCI